MKLRNNIKISIITMLLMISVNSCDLVDAINSYPVNVPITMQFTSTGTDNTIAKNSSFCLNDQASYQEYSDKIKNVKFVEMAFRTIAISPSNLQGNVKISLNDYLGIKLFEQTIPNVKPADFMTTPKVLTLQKAEIDAIDAYLKLSLETNGSICFTANLEVVITNENGTKSITGAVDMVFEAEAEL